MKKSFQLTGIGLCICLLVWFCGILGDRMQLKDDIIRLHVVADSDLEQDQTVKLQVRDAVIQYLSDTMETVSGREEANAYLQSHLPEIEAIANQTLQDAGFTDRAKVTLGQESFDTRHYDTFSLPAGVYESLRITIGSGEGRNWWCVVFPTLCLPATSEGFSDVAAGAGFPDSLTAALEGEEGYELRFWMLDALGKLEGYLWNP